MPRPTLEEVYSLPDSILRDCLSLEFVESEHFKCTPETFKRIRVSLANVDWQDAPNPFAPWCGGKLKLVFLDVDGDQDFLDAHAQLQQPITSLTFHVYANDGKAIREVKFTGVTTINSAQSFASDGRTGQESDFHARRVYNYAYETRTETKL